KNVCYTVCKPVHYTKTVNVCCGHWETQVTCCPGPVVTKCVQTPGTWEWDPCRCRCCYKPGCCKKVQVQCPPRKVCKKVWVPEVKQKCIQCVKYVRETKVKTCCYKVCKMVPETRTCTYKVCRMVPEKRVKTCCYKVCKMVPETRTRKVAYTCCRMVKEECVKMVPYTVCKPVHYTKQIKCKKCVCERVPYTVTRCVPKVVCKQVPVKVCCPVPCQPSCGCDAAPETCDCG
ncbi:MAG: hypothetical protein VX431_02840, partial [Planctomycetota bacterium]|nr:hypothetical protein [Planctomycetota bacterium]